MPGSSCTQKFTGDVVVSMSRKPAPMMSGPAVMNSRGPYFPASEPNRVEREIDMIARGMVARPAWRAVNPATSCRKIVMMNCPSEMPA